MAQTEKPAIHAEGEHRGPAETISVAVLLPVEVARQVLPRRGMPVYFGIAALTVANVIEWPIAVAAGLGYLAVRGWQRPAAAETSSDA